MSVKMFVLKNIGNGGLWNLLMKGLLHLIEADVASRLGLFIRAVKHRWAIVSLANYVKQSIFCNMKSKVIWGNQRKKKAQYISIALSILLPECICFSSFPCYLRLESSHNCDPQKH